MEFGRSPLPPWPQWGLLGSPSFPLPKLSRAVLIVAPCAAGPLRATPASASLLRDLLTTIAPSKRFLTFAFVILFARFLAPRKQPQKVQHQARYFRAHNPGIESENNMKNSYFFLAKYTPLAYSLCIEG